MSDTTEQFKPTRLTKKSLIAFLDGYEAALYKPMAGTLEERQAGYLKEWHETNELMKKDARLKKQQRRNKRELLKAKWGLKTGPKTKMTLARMSLIRQIKLTFDL